MHSGLRALAMPLFCAVLLVACQRDQDPEPPNPVALGWIGPLTGPASALGIDNLNAVELALEDYEASRHATDPVLSLLARDDGYDAAQSKQAYDELVATHAPQAVFVSTYTAMFLIADQALRDGVIVVNPVDNDDSLARLNKNVFMIAKRTESLARVLADGMTQHGRTSAVVLYFAGDDFMPSVAALLQEQFVAAGGNVLMKEYPPGTRDFAELLDGLPDGIDACVLLGYEEVGHAMNQAREEGLEAPFYTANAMMRQIAPAAMEGTHFFDITYLDGDERSASAFLTRYEGRFDRQPVLQWTALQAYDATQVLIGALREADRGPKRIDQVRSALLRTQGFSGLSGTLSMRPDGTAEGIEPGLYTYASGHVQRVGP